MSGRTMLLRANALQLPLTDESVDLIVTSPPYFALRSYQDGGEHYEGQLGAEATPTEFVDALIAATREMVRVLKPSGSIFVNLGDKYAGAGQQNAKGRLASSGNSHHWQQVAKSGIRSKSLMGIPWRYAIRCIDDLDLILRAEIIWAKPNGLPESVTDRVARKHEQWFHFTKSERYFAAVDTIREEHASRTLELYKLDVAGKIKRRKNEARADGGSIAYAQPPNSLGKLPGSVWTVATEPLRVPDELGVDHFAAFPTEFPRRIITGWSPSGICTACGEGRRPVTDHAPWWKEYKASHGLGDYIKATRDDPNVKVAQTTTAIPAGPKTIITGEACACDEPTAPTLAAVVLDPFGGTGTTASVAKALGRTGISVDLSADYLRIADWRCNSAGHDQVLRKLGKKQRTVKPKVVPDNQLTLKELLG